MRHATDFERPIDWLAARGITSRISIDPDCYSVLDTEIVKSIARRYRRETKKDGPYHDCLHEIVRALGFNGGWNEYVDFMKRRNEFTSAADLVEKKRVS